MMYRDHKEYSQQPSNPEYELLRSWLRGETSVESLRKWLETLYN